MVSSELQEETSTSTSSIQGRSNGREPGAGGVADRTVGLWVALDVATVVGAAFFASLHKFRGGRDLWESPFIHGRSVGTLLALVVGFTIALVLISKRLQLYSPTKLAGLLHEQRLNLQACLTAGLLLTCVLYLIRADDVPRSIVLITVGLVTISLSLRRLVFRIRLQRRFERGLDTRNVLIVGTGPEAHTLRHHLESTPRLGYTFKGFIEAPGHSETAAARDVVGSLENLFQNVRKCFVDEIFFTVPCDSEVVQSVLEQSRAHGVDLRVIPEMYDGMAWNSPVEYIGQFPTIPLRAGQEPEGALLIKHGIDILLSASMIVLFAPLMLFIALGIKLESRGPIFYLSDRIGKKGRVFRCIKFRTMIAGADRLQADVMHMNERDGVLFKISNDPRITRLGRLLRKYSLDELPQFFNVFRGDMSVVGPRPPLVSEVREYKLDHLRRLDVLPGITGLWQVHGRTDPSFDSYVSLDMSYIENWSLWLDLKIILRTIAVVVAGTGT